jgi:hypothetical protein
VQVSSNEIEKFYKLTHSFKYHEITELNEKQVEDFFINLTKDERIVFEDYSFETNSGESKCFKIVVK